MSLQPNKVCPVVLRRQGEEAEVLAFKHPLAGRQLVKGSIEAGEFHEAAALRELAEEAGILFAHCVRHLGTWESGFQGQVWAFIECHPAGVLPESWVHHAADDGGHDFEFFWHPLLEPVDSSDWHVLFQNALGYIRTAV